MCSFTDCKSKVCIIGKCKYCQCVYCTQHRLPEDHMCSQLQKVKHDAYATNSNILMQCKTVAKKYTGM